MSEAGTPDAEPPTPSASEGPAEEPAPEIANGWGWIKLIFGTFLLCLVGLVFFFDSIVDRTSHIATQIYQFVLPETYLRRIQGDIAITVASPSVHTRERLLNDRFEQISWLSDQIKNATLSAKGPMQAADRKGNDGQESPSTSDSPVTDKQKGLRRDRKYSVEIGSNNPRTDFEVINGYRDLLRAERSMTMLDDRHDMDDNTIYLLSFDTTVIPSSGVEGFAIVEAEITRDWHDLTAGLTPGSELDGLRDALARLDRYEHQDTFDIYLDWLERIRKLDARVIPAAAVSIDSSPFTLQTPLTSLLPTLEMVACAELLYSRNSRHSPPPQTDSREKIRRFEIRKFKALCLRVQEDNQKGFGGVAGTAEPEYDLAKSALDSVEFSLGRFEKIIQDQERQKYNKQSLEHWPNYRSNLIELRDRYANEIPSNVLERITKILKDPSLAIDSFDEVLPLCHGYSLVSPKDADLYAVIRDILPPTSWKWQIPPGAPGGPPYLFVQPLCPRVVTPAERARHLLSLVASFQENGLSGSGFDKIGADDPDQPDGGTQNYFLRDYVKFLFHDAERFVSSSCIAAIWLQEQTTLGTADAPRNHGASLEEFFDFDVTHTGDGSCEISIKPKISSLRATSKENIDLLGRLHDLLDGPGYSDRVAEPFTRAFSYGLSPRLREHFRARGGESGSASGSLLGSDIHWGENETLSIDTTEPEVIGFNRPPLTERKAINGARFGWLIAPQPYGPSPRQTRLPMQQVQLGALLAVPSWWRSALLQICTGVTSNRDLARMGTDDFWLRTAHCHVEPLRLPGTASDVSRHLGMDVLTYPYVWPPTLPDGNQSAAPIIFADDKSRPASLLIHGERLWRSTVVTLGGQEDDHIQVLPDMSGIIATFACVDVPTVINGVNDLAQSSDPAMRDQKDRYWLYDVPVIVWTSEGHSEDFLTKVAVRKDPVGNRSAQPCHPPEKLEEKIPQQQESFSTSVHIEGKTAEPKPPDPPPPPKDASQKPPNALTDDKRSR